MPNQFTIPLPDAPEAVGDLRLPAPGNFVVRKYKGQTIQVLVLAEGFEYEGQRYRSLSAIAKLVSGSHVNGFRFFKLGGDA